MANSAHVSNSGADTTPVITVRDNQGNPITELDPPETGLDLEQIDSRLRAAGWTRNKAWNADADGWTAPVVPS